MATNEILPFDATDTNILTQSEYNSDAQRTTGNQPGIARSKLVNKALKQSSAIAAGVAQFLADNQAVNITDSLTAANLSAYLTTSVTAVVNPILTSGNYAKLDTQQNWTAGQAGPALVGTDGATITLAFGTRNNHKIELGGNRTLGVPTGLAQGQSGMIDVYQGTAGSHTLSYAWVFSWPGGTAGVLTTTAATKDALAYYVDTYSTATVTTTIASPGVVTHTAHGLFEGEKVQLTTTGALPTGFSASTTYYVKKIDANSYSLSATAGGSSINTSGSQSGVHTAIGAGITLSLGKAIP